VRTGDACVSAPYLPAARGADVLRALRRDAGRDRGAVGRAPILPALRGGGGHGRMMQAMVPPELVAAGVTLLLLGGLILALVRSAGSRAKARTERDALARAKELQDEAARARDQAEREGRAKYLG